MTIYNTRSMFDIAHDADTGFRVYGIWYRHNPIEYWVMNDHSRDAQGFDSLPKALEFFETKISKVPA